MTKFEELVCSSNMARYFLSTCHDAEPKYDSWLLVLYDWQTLITGLLAVVAAVVGGGLLVVQIRDQRRQFQEERRQQIKATLIQIPHALTEMNSYLVGCYDAWKRKTPDERPRPPSEALKIIMDAAAVVDEGSFKSMQQLIVNAQTFESRVQSPGRQRPHNVLDTMIVDIAELSYLTTRLFKFGRMDEDTKTIPYVKPTRGDLEEVLARDFDLKLLLETDPLLARVERALRLRFPGSRATPGSQ
ncbi:hypothetical protein NKH19_30580 [Mesorhizobium sp. M1338]|uniref:hypothetical protein n=1 Tax=Mesorhizobium sp. M1338 TaxID=2957085 RepID=UPI00333653D8